MTHLKLQLHSGHQEHKTEVQASWMLPLCKTCAATVLSSPFKDCTVYFGVAVDICVSQVWVPSENLAFLTESSLAYVKLRHRYIKCFLRFAHEALINQKPVLCRMTYQKQICDLMSSSMCWMCNWSWVYRIIYLRFLFYFACKSYSSHLLPRTWRLLSFHIVSLQVSSKRSVQSSFTEPNKKRVPGLSSICKTKCELYLENLVWNNS